MARIDASLLLAATLFLSSVLLAQGAPQPAAPPTLKATSRIVVIDVGVTDGQGNPIKDLKASDFTLKENGAAQTIAHFEAHASLPAGEAAKLPPMPKLDANTFTNYSPTPTEGALNVLLLDALNTPIKDQSYVRQEMLKYLKTPHPGTRMAIFGLTSQLVLLQGFTSDPDTLRKALASAKNGPKASIAMDNALTGDAPGSNSSSMDMIMDALGNDPDMATLMANLQQFDAEMKSYQLQMRIQYTLDAMNNLARYLSGLPGRKNLIWFSGSFPVNIMPDGDLADPFSVMADFSEEYHKTATALQKSQVAVYPIDARGLMTAPMFDAQNSGANLSARNPKAMMKDQQAFFTNTASENHTMQQMADDTGGKAFINTNDLATAVQRAVDAGSNYYTLVYTPTNKDWKGDFRKVQVQLAKSGYSLTYRHGYFADDDTPKKKKDDGESGAPMMVGGGRGAGVGRGTGIDGTMAPPGSNPMDPKRAAMRAAMQFGGPDPTEILFKTAINPVTGLPEKEVAKGNIPNPKLSGPYERYVIYIAALASDFTFAPIEGGKRRLAVEFVTNIYNTNGEVMNIARVRAARDVDDAQYNAILRGGLQFRQEISAPVKGETFLRIGLHDLASDRVGAVEIPVSTLAKLPPLPAAAGAAVTPEPARKPPTMTPPPLR
jgi:VWFA-related protein